MPQWAMRILPGRWTATAQRRGLLGCLGLPRRNTFFKEAARYVLLSMTRIQAKAEATQRPH
jgi:hypothetical protein